MSRDQARLTVYFGERGRGGGELLAERIMTVLEGSGLATAVLLRGGEGFGPKHRLRTSGQLSLSEDLPMVAAALDSGERIEAVAKQLRPLFSDGLLTVEPVRAGSSAAPDNLMEPGRAQSFEAEFSSLTIWTARHDRVEGAPAHVSLIEMFRQQGLSAAIALPGVDGLAGGVRQRAGFFSANRSVPMCVIGIGQREAVGSAMNATARLLPDATVENPRHVRLGSASPGGLEDGGLWRLSIYGDGTEPGTGIHRQREIVRMLRVKGAYGVTAYFGHYGFVRPGEPQGDSLRSLRRRVPVLTEVIDGPGNCRRWMREIEEMDDSSLLMTISPVGLISPPAGPA